MYNNYKGDTMSTMGLKDSLIKEMTFAQRYERWGRVLLVKWIRVAKVIQENEVRSWSVCGTTNSSAFLEHKVEIKVVGQMLARSLSTKLKC